MYEIYIERNAEKELNALNSPIFDRIRDAILDLANNPRPFGYRKLKGLERYLRIKVGDYRIIYEINDKSSEVKIEKVRHRKNVYR
ncbi:MAG: type II toxin-antitoxin system RelE/ParE family toxin [Candidatus Kapabacteria bacterium]|nr:type II toxin-antitoxin system RelE/ParE family toxin [Candidatus Kapabacteria bacterium]